MQPLPPPRSLLKSQLNKPPPGATAQPSVQETQHHSITADQHEYNRRRRHATTPASTPHLSERDRARGSNPMTRTLASSERRRPRLPGHDHPSGSTAPTLPRAGQVRAPRAASPSAGPSEVVTSALGHDHDTRRAVATTTPSYDPRNGLESPTGYQSCAGAGSMAVCPQAEARHHACRLGRKDIRPWRPTSIGVTEELPWWRPRGLGRERERRVARPLRHCQPAFARRRLKINVALVPSKLVRFLAQEEGVSAILLTWFCFPFFVRAAQFQWPRLLMQLY